MQARERVLCVGVLAGTAVLAGCSVHVNKGGNGGEDKDVQIHVPFGNLQVHKNKSSAGDLGLPAYPGAVPEPDKDGDDDKSVDVQMGFGKWQMRVQVANYSTPDGQAKVQDFYRKALGRYGEVLACRGDEPVGSPARTGAGLTCKDTGDRGKFIHVTSDAKLELKAGSERRQHIVAFDNKGRPGTHFSLISLMLPPSSHGDSGGNLGGEEE